MTHDGTQHRVMAIMAHPDDAELNLGGTLARLKQAHGHLAEIIILTTTRGASGHHELSPTDTFKRRQKEAQSAARIIDAEYECLKQLDGNHLEGQVSLTHNFLGGLWNAIRSFQPTAIFTHPITTDLLAGVHIDHERTAHAVRYVAYQLQIPHAYPAAPQAMSTNRMPTPLILNIDDIYASEGAFDIRQDIRASYEPKLAMTLCHRSQIFEWHPWLRDQSSTTSSEWESELWQRHMQANRRYEQNDEIPSEYFRITRWGRSPASNELEFLFPDRIAAR